MLSSRKLHFLLALLLCTGTAFAGDKSDDAKPAKDGDKKKAAAADSGGKHGAKDDKGKKDDKDDKGGEDSKEKGKLSLPLLPPGQPSRGLKIPYYDAAGKLQMIFTIGVAERKDADHVEMSAMTIETFDEHGDSEMGIDLPTSLLDLNTRVLTSPAPDAVGTNPTTIKRDDFQISGDSVEFNTLTKKSKLVGHVHMFIYDLNEAASSPAAVPKPQPPPKKKNE